MSKDLRPIDTLKNWASNPRGILREDFERLKKQLQKFGQYKPLLITEDGTVLGGNMRLKAMQELGIKDVWISVVDAPDEKTKLEYALSDNDRAGYYEEQQLAELVMSVPDLELGEYKVDLGKIPTLQELLSRFGPDKYGETFELPSADFSGVEQMTFTLTSAQVATVREALAKAVPLCEATDNQNENGNALALIAKQWMEK